MDKGDYIRRRIQRREEEQVDSLNWAQVCNTRKQGRPQLQRDRKHMAEQLYLQRHDSTPTATCTEDRHTPLLTEQQGRGERQL